MIITNSILENTEEILNLYSSAIQYQIKEGSVPWAGLTRNLVEEEITENRQWKMIIDGHIACVWMTSFSDAQIWEERNTEPSVYIHRIATNPDFRGKKLVSEIVKWGKDYVKTTNKKYLRLDTAGFNPKLIKHYESCGFSFLGVTKLSDTKGLPDHYHKVPVCLLEIDAHE